MKKEKLYELIQEVLEENYSKKVNDKFREIKAKVHGKNPNLNIRMNDDNDKIEYTKDGVTHTTDFITPRTDSDKVALEIEGTLQGAPKEDALDEKKKKKRKKRKKKSKTKKDACYHKVKSRYDVWPSAYASGALVKCRKVGAKNWGKSKKNEEVTPEEEEDLKNVSKELAGASKMHKKQSDRIKKALKSEQKKNCGCGQDPCKTYGIQETKEVAEDLKKWFDQGGWVQAGGKYDGEPCAKQPGQKTKPKCVSSAKRRSMSKKERESAARRKRKKDPNPDRRGKPKNVSTDPKTKKKKKS